MSALYETYRPKTWADVLGQDKVVAKVRALAERGLGGHAFWLSGASGTRKTTIARLLAGEVADPDFIEEADATTLTPARLQDIEATMHHYGWGQGRPGLHRQRSPRAEEGRGAATAGAPGEAAGACAGGADHDV